jgi:putative Holliday junction resolvase
MNYLSIDYGTKQIGLAHSINGIIFTLDTISNNNKTIEKIKAIVKENHIDKIYVGLSTGRVAKLTREFIDQLCSVIKLPVDTVEESVSTIEAQKLLKDNKTNKAKQQKFVDSVSAAIILRRVIN